MSLSLIEAGLPRGQYNSHEPSYAAQGDFAHFDHPTKIHLIDLALGSYYNAHDIALGCAHSTHEAAEREALRYQAESKILTDQVEIYRQYVNAYPDDVRAAIAIRYVEADLTTTDQDMDTRVAARLSTMNGVQILSDMDKTITQNDTYLPLIPGSINAETQLERQGREAFAEVFVRNWRPALEVDPGAFKEVGKGASLRPGVQELFREARASNVEISVLSANFEPFVYGVLSQIPDAEGINVWAVRQNSIIATDKGSVLKHTAFESPEQGVVFLGDGASDLPTLEARDYIACYFALEGSVFAKQLEEKGLAFYTYRDFNDIRVKLQELGIFASRASQAEEQAA